MSAPDRPAAATEGEWYAPPGGSAPRGRRPLQVLGAAFLLLTGAGLLGWFAGATYRQLRQGAAPAVARAAGGAVTDEDLAAARRRRRRNATDPQVHMELATLFYLRAETADLPAAAREALRREAAAAADLAWAVLRRQRPREAARPTPGTEAFALRLTQAELLLEAGRAGEAKPIFEELLVLTEGRRTMRRAMLLNNLAWLLLTAAEPDLRNPERALELARRAVKLVPAASRQASFLDTLATAYYTRGDFAQALTVQKEALIRADTRELPALLETYDRIRQAVGGEGPRAEEPPHGDAN